MKQPEYLILNPVFNKYPKDLITYRYINKPEPYTNIFGEIGWRNVKVFQAVKLYFKFNDITDYNEYLLERLSEMDKGKGNYVKLN
jgi:hypothetical protein